MVGGTIVFYNITANKILVDCISALYLFLNERGKRQD
jgi:hypothetical protein